MEEYKMIIWATKFGIFISLFMVAHALFYPNRFSLIIAIFGYIIAIGSATIYGLCKSNKKLQKGMGENLLETTSESFSKDSTDITSKMFSSILPRSNNRSTIQALIKEKDTDERTYTISGAEDLDEFETIREKDWIKRPEDDKYRDDLPGYQ